MALNIQPHQNYLSERGFSWLTSAELNSRQSLGSIHMICLIKKIANSANTYQTLLETAKQSFYHAFEKITAVLTMTF